MAVLSKYFISVTNLLFFFEMANDITKNNDFHRSDHTSVMRGEKAIRAVGE